MRIVCPSCNATYEVPAPLLGNAARRLRCARCQREWSVEGPAPAPANALAERAAPARIAREQTARDQIGRDQAGRDQAGRDQAGRDQTGPMARFLDGGATDHPGRSAPAATAERARVPVDDDPFALEPAIRERLERNSSLDRALLPPPTTVGRPVPLARPSASTLTAQKRSRPVIDASTRGLGAGVALAWVLSVAVLCVCIGAAFVWRADVMRLWPPSERIYLALGLR
jgi:predicted Zn finger-like uncharacterized protein